METRTSSVSELCDRVTAGDPEAERRFEREYTMLAKFLIRRSQASLAASGSAAASYCAGNRVLTTYCAGNRVLTTPDEAHGQSAVARLAQRICRRAIDRLQEGRRETRHDTVGGRGGWLTARF